MTTKPKRTTLRSIRAALAAAGYPDARVARGRGYYCFTGTDAAKMRESGVYGVKGLGSFTAAEWAGLFKNRLVD